MVIGSIISVNTKNVQSFLNTKTDDWDFLNVVENSGVLLTLKEEVVGDWAVEFRERQMFATTMLSS